MEDEASKHVVTFLVDFVFFLLDVEFTEEVEGDDGVDVHDNSQEHDSQNQLFAVVCDWLQDGLQRWNGYGHIQQVSGEEEIIVIAQDREDKVQQRIQKSVVCNGDACLPDLFGLPGIKTLRAILVSSSIRLWNRKMNTR